MKKNILYLFFGLLFVLLYTSCDENDTTEEELETAIKSDKEALMDFYDTTNGDGPLTLIGIQMKIYKIGMA